MNSKHRCPECKQGLTANRRYCVCGWESDDAASVTQHDDQCAYELAGLQCPLPGTNCASRSSRVWYCRAHHQHLDDPVRCEAILMDAVNHFVSIMDEHIDWRVKLIPEEYQARQVQIQQFSQTIRRNDK